MDSFCTPFHHWLQWSYTSINMVLQNGGLGHVNALTMHFQLGIWKQKNPNQTNLPKWPEFWPEGSKCFWMLNVPENNRSQVWWCHNSASSPQLPSSHSGPSMLFHFVTPVMVAKWLVILPSMLPIFIVWVAHFLLGKTGTPQSEGRCGGSYVNHSLLPNYVVMEVGNYFLLLHAICALLSVNKFESNPVSLLWVVLLI